MTDPRWTDAFLMDRTNRRKVLQGGLASLLGAAAIGIGQPLRGAPVQRRQGLLQQPADIDELSTRCKMAVELNGELRIKEPDPSKPQGVRSAEVRGKSTFEYAELITYADDQVVAVGREYILAKSENWIQGSRSDSQLRDACSQTRIVQDQEVWRQFCPEEPLDLREIDLLQLPVNTFVLERMLPVEPAKPDQPWKISSATAQALFNLEKVWESTIEAHISKVENGVATVEFEGTLDATANSVATQLNVRGNFQVKLASHGAMITWLGLVIKEEREISHAEPGFAITARIRLIREAASASEVQFGSNELRQLASPSTQVDNSGRWLARLRSDKGGYSMLVERNWHVFIDSGEEAILRMVEDDKVIAQCNIANLPQLDDGQQLTIEGLQADIKASLGVSFSEFLETSETLTDSKLRLLKCVVHGQREEVPIQWIYTHLSDDAGRRIALVYTMGGNLTDRFAAADEQMVSSLVFIERKASSPPGTQQTPPEGSAEVTRLSDPSSTPR